ncbi:hypothetical protein [Streptomyces sp. NRRL S-37]|uniref:hypothetical protein n=1 Tax=Streptomyces sp. NRRL S-37 TaxID=1463903 RepID=UPI0004C4B521|nr:hypothetical protein [Streptomyces sp. NRRL S-37]
MHLHLRTRGTPRGLDYGFINSPPGTRWWDAYSDWTVTERPCLLAVAEEGREHWRVLLSGIPSARTDSGGRLIYYTLVLEGAYDTAEENEAVVLSLASRLLTDLAADEQGRGELSGLLDGVCPAEEVDRLLAAPAEHTAHRAALTDRLLTAITALEPVRYEAPGRTGNTDRWIAGRAAPGAAAAFLTRLSALLSGTERGQAHLLNLISEPEDVVDLFPGRLAVLVEGGQVGDPAMPFEKLPAPGPPRPPVAAAPAGPHPKARWRTPMAQASVAALLLLLVLVGVLWISEVVS